MEEEEERNGQHQKQSNDDGNGNNTDAANIDEATAEYDDEQARELVPLGKPTIVKYLLLECHINISCLLG